MMTYSDLKKGKCLQEEDKLLIHGHNYIVKENPISHRYYLDRELGGANNVIFNEYGLTGAEKIEWARKYDPSCNGGQFPEIAKLQDLTNFVIAIYEKSPYKIGDKVKIKKREGQSFDYPFGFTDMMCSQEGKTGEITAIEISPAPSDMELIKYYNGDPHIYKINGECWLWHSSMFEWEPIAGMKPSKPANQPKEDKSASPSPDVISRKNLNEGYVLEIGDKIILNECEYVVRHNGAMNRFWLTHHSTGEENKIFKEVGIPEGKEVERFVNRFGKAHIISSTAFPEMESLKELTDLVFALSTIVRDRSIKNKTKTPVVAVIDSDDDCEIRLPKKIGTLHINL